MKKLLQYILLIAIMLPFSACEKPEQEGAHWASSHTLMFYFVGTDLSDYFNNNIIATKKALCDLSKANGALSNTVIKPRVIYFRNKDSKRDTGEIVELVYSNGQCTEKTWATFTLPDIITKEDMSRYIQNMVSIAPADSYGLVFGAHSRGWVPYEAPDFYKSASAERLHSIVSYWHRDPNAPVTRFMGEGYPFFSSYKAGKSNMFNIEEIAEAISATGIKPRYTIYDACLMANIEVLYDLRNSSDYIIASVCEIMGDGFPYKTVIPMLLRDNGRSFDLDGVCRAYKEHYEVDLGYSGSVALIDCSQLDALAEVVRAINLGDTHNNTSNIDTDLLQTYEGLKPHLYYDFGEYFNKLCTNATLKEEFNNRLNRAVPSKYTLSRFLTTFTPNAGLHNINQTVYSGISTSQPSSMYRTEYYQTEWYKATH